MVRGRYLWLVIAVFGCDGKDNKVETPTLPPPEQTSDLEFVEPTAVPGGLEIRLKPESGVSYQQEMVGDIEVWPVPGKPSVPEKAIGKTRMTMDYTVEVANSDIQSVTLAFASSSLKLEGKAQGEWQQLGGQKGEVRFDRRAALLEDPSSLFEGLFGAGMIMFPESPIGPGSTWSSSNTRDMPPFGPVKVQEEFTYRGTEKKDGVTLHRIDSKATGSLEGMTIDATYFVREDGMPYAATIKSKAASPIAVQDNGTQVWAGFTVNVEIKPKKG